MNSAKKLQNLALRMVTITLVTLLIHSSITLVSATPALFLNIFTDKEVYEVGDTVKITGNVTMDDTPVTDALVAIQTDSPDNNPCVIRTVQTGPISNTNWEVNITALYTCDLQGNPKDSFGLDSTVYYNITWRNYSNDPKPIKIAVYIEYSNRAPFKAYFPTSGVVSPRTEESLIAQFQIPSDAPLGITTIYANIYTQEPKEDGYAYCPEEKTTFTIESTRGSSAASMDFTATLGSPNFYLNFSLVTAKPGTYDVYATTKYQASQVSSLLTFGVQPKELPPIADFQYYPMPAGANMTITFDASGSLAQGYNDTITRYEWRFGDGTAPVITTNPKATHIFTINQTYIVTLNVTDNEGLWNTTSKPVNVLSLIPPTADFSWSPQLPYANQTITFDAGISKLGWNGTGNPPIVSCQWDFGDGFEKIVSSLTIDHQYIEAGNYTVILTITDSHGQQDYEIKIITVFPPPPQGNGDVNGDGQVDMTDIVIVVDAFGSTPGKPNWDERADIDRNGRVDMTDVMIVVSNFGKKV